MVAMMPAYLLNNVRPMIDNTKILLPNNVYNKKSIFLPQKNIVAATKAMDTKIE
jgi:hypothetical protein